MHGRHRKSDAAMTREILETIAEAIAITLFAFALLIGCAIYIGVIR